MKKNLSLLIIILISDLCCFAQWSTNPSVNNAITTAVSTQENFTVISDGSGGAIVAWEDNRSLGATNLDIYVQRINASGVVQWTNDGVAICTAALDQRYPMIVGDGSGGAIITWQDDRLSNRKIYAQRINSSGVVQWANDGVIICSASSNAPTIVEDGSGGAIISWYGYSGGNDNIYAQRVNASGTVQWTTNGVAICTAVGNQQFPKAVSDGLDGAIITWQDLRGGMYLDIYAQRVNISGLVQWVTNGTSICTAFEDQKNAKIVSDSAGGAIICWEDSRTTGSTDIYSQRVSVTGAKQWMANGVATCSAISNQYSPSIISDGNGGAFISWQDDRSFNSDIFAQYIGASGTTQWIVNGTSISDTTSIGVTPSIILDGNGGAIITWVSVGGVFAQRVNSTGALQWTLNGIAVCNATGGKFSPLALPVGNIGAIITWVDYRANYDIYSQFINSNGILCNNPVLSITGTSTVCIGSSTSFTTSGALTYTWNTGATTASATVTPVVNTIYTVTGTDVNNCYDTQTVTVTVNNTCADVWPGDANSDGSADNLDVLELGLHFIQTGPSRTGISNLWQAYFSNNWVGTITNGKNLMHSDCNGDGIINDNDTLAISNNYGLTHTFKPAQTNTVNPQLSIVPDQTGVVKGTWGTASIYLGSATSNITNINGVAFTVDFDNAIIETNSIYLEYQNSFLDAGQNLDFRKLDFSGGKIFTATTHTVNNNVSGYGKIATLHYQIKSSLSTDEVLNFGLTLANQSDASGAISPLTSGTGTLMAIGASVGLKELNGNVISVSPNPTSGSLTICSKNEIKKIEVVSITGQLLLSEIPTNVSHTLHLENFANGIYFINLYQNDRIVKRERVVLNK